MKQHSKIPLWSLYEINSSATTTYRERRTQYRDNENYLLRLNSRNIDDFEASLTAIYAPYTYQCFQERGKDSDYDIKGGGLNIAYDMKNALSFGVFKNVLAYKSDENYGDGHSDFYGGWKHNLGYANWLDPSQGITSEGNFKQRELSEQSFIYKGSLTFNPIETGEFAHNLKTGLEAEFGKASYKRDTTPYFSSAVLNASVTGNKEDGIIAGEQWAANKTVYEARDSDKGYTTAAIFLEDGIKFDRYLVRPGLRISTDTVTDNTDIAPRLFANADVFNDKVFNIYGGYNRYYGGLIMYNAIYNFRFVAYSRTLSDLTAWTPLYSYAQDYSLDGIKTPYSDEFSVGSSLAKWDTIFKLDFVSRKHRDQLKTKMTDKSAGYAMQYEYENTNDGKSDYWGVTLSASKEYELGATRHFSELSITNSDAKTNMNGLNSFANEADATYSPTHVTYDGALKKAEDVPSPSYNSPLVITYAHNMALSDFLRLGLNARYEKGVDGYKWKSDSGGIVDPNGLPTKVYETKRYGDTFTVDLSADYKLKFGENKLTFGVEILNLLNRKNDASYSTSSSNIEGYAMGRQFYANVKYEY